ncbi:hypothetical protein H5410_048135 [Solanum commersonii]|uniref:Uncharacterized protein n=1 Tax=Solanum commersonii TaxID=4109 RepID=A0A9J5XIW8_SOLCO|nr:hypothetical protein H5410_048135 [Solanum commersonii]
MVLPATLFVVEISIKVQIASTSCKSNLCFERSKPLSKSPKRRTPSGSPKRRTPSRSPSRSRSRSLSR